MKTSRIKNKINNAPEKDFDQQQIGYKLREFIKLTNDVQSGKKLKKKIPAGTESVPRNSKVKKIPKIKQFSGEEDQDFLKRVNRVTAESLKETGFEAKYGINVYKDPKTGKITVLQGKGASKNPEDNDKKAKKQKILDDKKAKMIKEAIKEEMLARKKDQKEEIKPEFQREEIKFGEIVHGPPTLTALPRKAQKADTVPRVIIFLNIILYFTDKKVKLLQVKDSYLFTFIFIAHIDVLHCPLKQADLLLMIPSFAKSSTISLTYISLMLN